MKKLKVLVTGGGGFIGTYVCEQLERAGYEPYKFDHRGPTEFQGDIRDYADVSEAIAITDGVIHLAGILGTSETIQKPMPVVEVNIKGALNVYEACAHYKKPCVNIAVGNYFENSTYAITKNMTERFAFMFNKERGTKITVVRGLNVYGPRQKHAPVRKIIPNFVLPALRNEAITIYGSGNQVMDMIYAPDIADVLVRALTVDHGIYDKVFEAGTGIRTTVNDIADIVIRTVGSGKIRHVLMRPGESLDSVVVGNPETLMPLYDGKLPEFTRLEEGLKPTVEWYREILVNGEI